MNKKIKVLLVTSMPWRNDNNIGNSYSNIFGGLNDKVEFAHLYCRAGMPQNNICHKYFQLDESKLLENIFFKKKLGNSFFLDDPLNTPKEVFSSGYNKMRLLRWEIFFLTRNIMWTLSDWKTDRLDEFVQDFQPDVIFATLTYMPNINKMLVYLKDKFNIPLFIYSWDDVYFTKKISISPIYYIRRTNQRKWIRETMKRASKMYAITNEMKREYSDYFAISCDILRKGYNFDHAPAVKKIVNENIKMVYAGNIGDNRWIALSKIVKVLKICNDKVQDKHITLDIYTLSPVTGTMKNKLTVDKTSCLKEPLSPDEVNRVLQDSDILLHVESFDSNNLNKNRLSFSTKIVDYLYKGKCILAVGGKNASMDYLKKNDAAIVVNQESNIENAIMKIIENPSIITKYGNKSWECGCRNHDIKKIQNMLLKDWMKVNNEE